MSNESNVIPTLPLEPLWRAALAQSDLPDAREADDMRAAVLTGFNTTIFADMIGVSARNVSRWRKDNKGIPWPSADEAAIRLGLHPSLVWGEDWWNVKGDFAEIAAEAWADMDAALDAEMDGIVSDALHAEVVGSLDDLAGLMSEAY